MKWLKALGGLLVITMLFASCIKVEGEVVIDDDGSGEVDFLTAVDADRIGDLLGELAGSSDQICDDFASDQDTADLPAGASVSEYNEDGFCGARIEYDLPAALDHSANMSDLFDEQTTLFKDGDNWFFESQFSPDDITSDAEEFGDPIDFFGDATFRIVIDLPGRAVPGENNATAVGNDGRFTWDIDLLDPPTSLFAQTEPGSGGGTGGGDGEGDGDGGGGFLRVLGLLVVLGLIGAGIWWFLKNRGGGDTTAEAATDTISPIGAMPQDPTFSPPLATGPPPMDTALGGSATFTPDASKETIVMSTEEAQRFAAEARGQASGAASGLAGGVAGAGGLAGDAAGAAGGLAGGLAGDVGGLAGDAGGLAGGAAGLAGDAAGAAGGLAGDAGGAAGGLAGDAGGLAGDVGGLAAGAAGGLAAGAAGAAGGLAGDVAGAAGDAAAGAASGLGDATSGIAGAAASTAADAAAGAASTDPVWDEALGAWVLDHPTRGRLRHDPASDSWNPI